MYGNPLVINPGELRHRIEILSPAAAAADSRGLSIAPASWTTVRTCFSSIALLAGRETMTPGRMMSDVTHLITVRWAPPAIRANYRVVFGSRVFTVQYVDNVQERNRVLKLYCLEINEGGQ